MKTCTRCGAMKVIEEFQIRRASHDGLTAACKACLKAYDDARASHAHRVAARAEYMRTEGGKAAHARAARNSNERHPMRRRARNMLYAAVRDGKLKPWPACSLPEGCDSTKVEAHHADYSRPLDVVWLCQAHHKQAHALFTHLI